MHKFATCNSIFEESHLSDMQDIQADFKINRPFRYQITAKKIIDTDGRTDRQQ